jgi:putative ABC transport system substrate-binding protein
VRRQVAAIVASGGPVSALAANALATSIPIVFTAVADPVKSGLVESFNRPNGNVTGIAALTSELDPKRLELLCELVPAARTIGALANPHRPNVEAELSVLKEAAVRLGRQLLIVHAASENEIDAAFEMLHG